MSVSAASGRVFVDKPEVLDDLIEFSVRETVSRGGTNRRLDEKRETGPRSKSADDNHKRLMRLQHLQEAQKIDLLTKANIQKTIRRNAEKKDQQFQRLVSNVEDAKKYLSVVDRSLELQNEATRNKVRRQFEEWNNTVHGKIQGNITTQINNMDYKEINKRRNEDYDKFLSVTNRKAAIFRDIIIESEYDPLEPNRRAVKASVGKIKDPTKVSLQKSEEEASMLGTKSVSPTKSVGKYTLPVEQWASGKIEGTPHGRFNKMMGSNTRVFTEFEEANLDKLSKSHIVFDHYNYAIGKDVLESEMPKGKRTYPSIDTKNITKNVS